MSYDSEGKLSPREKQTADLVSRGMRNKEIAVSLSLKESTVEQYLSNVYEKLGVESRTQLTRKWLGDFR